MKSCEQSIDPLNPLMRAWFYGGHCFVDLYALPNDILLKIEKKKDYVALI
jgi:hypothetical protein